MSEFSDGWMKFAWIDLRSEVTCTTFVRSGFRVYHLNESCEFVLPIPESPRLLCGLVRTRLKDLDCDAEKGVGAKAWTRNRFRVLGGLRYVQAGFQAGKAPEPDRGTIQP